MPEEKDELSKADALEFLGLQEKVFENYFKNAAEFSPLPRQGKGRFYFSKKLLEKWIENYKWRTVVLDREDYRLCLDFALAQHFRGYVLSDWGTGRQREFGQKMTNWIKGQLAEVAVKKFFEKEFSLKVELDFAIRDEIVPQDITGIFEAHNVKRHPKINVSIKSSKPKSAYLVLGENEITLENRRSDVYIFCRPDLPDDHLLRLTKQQIMLEVEKQQHYSTYKEKIPDFAPVPCEIAGFCWLDELEKVTEIPSQEFDGTRYVKQTGKLHRDKKDWKTLISRL